VVRPSIPRASRRPKPKAPRRKPVLVAKYGTMRPYGPAALRLCVGAVFVAHGAQKLFGVWNGPGLAGTATYLVGLGVPSAYAYPVAIVTGLAQFGGGALLILGGLTRWVALLLALDMSIAIWKVHYPHGFFIESASGGQGLEFCLVLLGSLVCLMLSGPGALSVDERRSSSTESMRAGRARARNM
jgi:putative oxidoreductase